LELFSLQKNDAAKRECLPVVVAAENSILPTQLAGANKC